MSKKYEITADNAIAVLRRMQEPDPFEPQITQVAFDALEMAIDMIERYSTWSQTYSNMVEDTISRKAAIDAIRKWESGEDFNFNNGLICAMNSIDELPSAHPGKVCIAKITLSEEQVREAVEKAKSEIVQVFPSTQPEQQWIPCSEPPKESGTYIVTAYDGTDKRVTFVKYQKTLKRWDLTGARSYWHILAYKPLPEPWKGEDDAQQDCP